MIIYYKDVMKRMSERASFIKPTKKEIKKYEKLVEWRNAENGCEVR